MTDNKPHHRYGLYTALLLLCCSSAVAAETVMQTASWSTNNSISSGTDTDNQSDSLSASDVIDFVSFDGSLGTLDSVTINISNISISAYAAGSFRDPDWFNTVKGNSEFRDVRVYWRVNARDTFADTVLNVIQRESTILDDADYRQDTCSDTSGTGAASCTTGIDSGGVIYPNQSLTITEYPENHPFSGSLLHFYNNDEHPNERVYVAGIQTVTLWTNEYDGDDGYVNSRSGQFYTSADVELIYHYTPAPVLYTPVPIPFGVTIGMFMLFTLLAKNNI